MERTAGPDWPRVLVPAVGAMPPAAHGAPKERVLHIALRTSSELQPGLEEALRGISSQYRDIDWMAVGDVGDRLNRVLALAADIAPTLVFMQLQTAGVLEPHHVRALRGLCDPNAVIVNWDGDQHYEPCSPERRWFAELGRVCDTSLVVNTDHPHKYATMGVRHPGYLQIGTDYRWAPGREPRKGTPWVVLLAGCYPHLPAYEARRQIVARLSKGPPISFGVYGAGWKRPYGRPMLRQAEEAPVYAGCKAAISMSIRNDLPRYTSDRLFRALMAGALVLVEAFPDMEGLGLVDGENCLVWTTPEGLEASIAAVLKWPEPYGRVRSAGAMLAATYHTWEARMPELLAIVAAVREARAGLQAA